MSKARNLGAVVVAEGYVECVPLSKLMLGGNVYNVGLRIGRNGLEVLDGCYNDFRHGSQLGLFLLKYVDLD